MTLRTMRMLWRGAGPKLKELILERAAQDHSIDFVELKRLVDRAYPEQI